jgi:hypothetical protein
MAALTIRSRAGFNWTAVSWGGPDEPASDDCSYCEAPIPKDDVPLMIWTKDGWCARFCDGCQRTWFGMECGD